MDEELLEIPKSELEEIIKFSSNKLVGKCLRRFEIHDNLAVLKAELKELLYEGLRDIKDLLIASGHGLGTPTQFNLKSKGKTHSQ